MPPNPDFLPLAEQIGLIGSAALSCDWVIDEACRQALAWQEQGLDLYVSINLPPSYCQSTGMAHLTAAAAAAGVGLERLMIEVTESALVPDARRHMEDTLADMHKRGLKLAIDDFGTGYSSLGRLNKSWVSMLKIDRSFIQDIPANEHARTLVASIIQLRLAPTRLASSRSPKEWRPKSSAAFSSSRTAAMAKASFSAAPSLSTRSKRSTRAPNRTTA